MESVLSQIAGALAGGAAAVVSEAATATIHGAYNSLKALIQKYYPKVAASIENLEDNPVSQARRGVVEEELAKTEAANNPELLVAVNHLLEVLSRLDPEVANEIGVDLKDIKAGSVKISNASLGKQGVRIGRARVRNKLEISNSSGGKRASPQKKNSK